MPLRKRTVDDEARRPRCIKCGTQMLPASAKPKQAYGYRYEHRTFGCPKCKNVQTYTMASQG